MKILKVQAPDGTIVKVEGPDDATDEQFIQQGQLLWQQNQSIREQQASKFPSPATPGAIVEPKPTGVMEQLKRMGVRAAQNVGIDTSDPIIPQLSKFEPSRAGLNAAASVVGAVMNPGKTITRTAGEVVEGPMSMAHGIQNRDPGQFAEGATDTIMKTLPAVYGARKGAAALRDMLPSKARAGAKFQQVMSRAADQPLNTTAAQTAADRALELKQTGASMPKVINDFLKNRKKADAPMTFKTGRDFASNASRLSAKENTRLTPQMQSQVAQFAKAMKEANREAAVKVGMGDMFDQAMKEYGRAANLAERKAFLKDLAIKATIGAAGYKLLGDLLE